MRIGFAPAGSRDAAAAVAIGRQAEELGLDEVWLSEDYLERGAFAVAGGMAAVTSRIAIGIGVINPWTRHVALTAMEAAATNEIAQGRLLLGLGASNKRWMQDQLGIPFRRPIATLVDYADALRALLAGQTVRRDVAGLPVDARLSLAPQYPAPPIIFGVKGSRALQASADADGIMLSVLSSPPYIEWVRREYRPRDITAYVMVGCAPLSDAARARVASRTAHFLGVHGPTPITSVAGMPESEAAAFEARTLAGSAPTDLLTEEHLRAFTVYGARDECLAAIQRYARAGLDSFVVMDDGVSDPAEQLNQVASLARESRAT